MAAGHPRSDRRWQACNSSDIYTDLFWGARQTSSKIFMIDIPVIRSCGLIATLGARK
jgi:hypothetical protein